MSLRNRKFEISCCGWYNRAKAKEWRPYIDDVLSLWDGDEKDIDQFTEQASLSKSLEIRLYQNGGLLQDRSLGLRNQDSDFFRGSSFPRRRLISTEEAYFHGGGLYPLRR